MFTVKEDNKRLAAELDEAKQQLDEQQITLQQAQEVISNIERKVRKIIIYVHTPCIQS